MPPTGPDGADLPYKDPPEPGFELYRHRNAAAVRARGWHGLYWARRIPHGDYEIRSVPASLGEPSVRGGSMPKRAFERLYERATPDGGPAPE